MPENTRLSGSIHYIELGFVEREATPRFLMEARYSEPSCWSITSNTVSILEIFGVKRARSTVHNWVHKADLQPESGRCPDHVAVDETVIRLNDEQYWRYAAVDPETNELLIKLEPTRIKVFAYSFLTELSEKHGNRNSVERVFREIKRRTIYFSNCFSKAEAETADDSIRSFSFAWNQLI